MTISPELEARMVPIWEAAYEALRVDLGTLEDLARAAAKAARKRDAREAEGRGRDRVADVTPQPRKPVVSPAQRAARKNAVKARRLAAPPSEERGMLTARRRGQARARAAYRERLTDAQREANNARQTERRHSAEAALTADQIKAKRAARRERDRARIAALSPEEREGRREAERARSAARHAALTPEQAAAHKTRQAAAYQRRKRRTT